MESTSTENTKELDKIYEEAFDCSKYHKTQVEVKTFSFKIVDE